MSDESGYWWDGLNPIVLTGSEMRVLWAGAVRYSMHRGTGASKMTAEAVAAHLRDIDDGTLRVIARDIEWEMRVCACPYFERIPKLIDEELERRGCDARID